MRSERARGPETCRCRPAAADLSLSFFSLELLSLRTQAGNRP